ncbi:MAG: hypothetical protein K8R54_14690 [Bacteroidales bacterium]|nr:hypothetical protein [Bacteroidales bacterium]
MTIYIIILIVATVGVALVTFIESLSKNKLIKYGSYVVYFLLIELILYAVTESITIPAVILVVVILIIILILLIKGSFIISSGNRTIKYIISFVFLAAAIFTGYSLYDSIMNPIRFNKEMNKRYQETVDELKRVRTAQVAYKNEYNKYTKYMDSLKFFVENGSMTVIRQEGDVPDSIYLQQGNNLIKAEIECLKLGIPGFKRDTVKEKIIDTLFKDYDINRFGIVPFTNGSVFDMDTASIEAGGLTINIFEAKVTNLELLKGMDKQLILNLDDNAIQNSKYPGLKVGSLEENNNNEGNWDKEFDLKK